MEKDIRKMILTDAIREAQNAHRKLIIQKRIIGAGGILLLAEGAVIIALIKRRGR